MRDGLWNWDRSTSFPILYKDTKGEYWIADGHHTIEAAQNEHFKTIECFVRDGDINDAIEYSYSKANRLHGLPISNSGKLKLVVETIKNPEMLSRISINLCKGTSKDIPSSRAIAQWLNIVSAVYVNNIWDRLIMNKMTTDYPWLLATKRIGLDGKRTTVKPIAPAPKPIATPKVEPIAPPIETAPKPMENAAVSAAVEPIDKEYGDPKMNAHNAIVIVSQNDDPDDDDTAPSEPIRSQAARLQVDGLASHYAHKIINEASQYKGLEGLELLPQVQENIQRAIVEQLMGILSKE